MKWIFPAVLIILSSNAEASYRSFKAVAEKATVELEQKKGDPQTYFARASHLDFPAAGRTVILKRSERLGSEIFENDHAGFSVRLGGSYAQDYAKPPVSGILIFRGRDIKLNPVSQSIDLAAEYLRSEGLDVADKAKAQVEIDSAVAALKTNCGGSLKVTVDWGTFKDAGKAANGKSVLEGLASLCSDADYKAAVSVLKEIRIRTGSTSGFTKAGESVTYTYAQDAFNTFTRSREWFEKNL